MGCFAGKENRLLFALAPGIPQVPQPPASDGDDIIPNGALCKVGPAGKKQTRRLNDSTARAIGDRFDSGVRLSPGFDLDKGEHPSAPGDEVNFT